MPNTSSKKPKSAPKAAKADAAKQKTPKKSPASKSALRETRKTRRLAAAAKGNPKAQRKVQSGYAPQSTRITPARGPVQSIASRTVFGQRNNQDRKWLLVDAGGQVVGRIASEIASLLRGKHKATFTPNNDAGDFVVVVNADKVVFTAKKEEDKVYIHHTGYTAGIKESTPAELRMGKAERILYKAVQGMVPRTPLGRQQMTKLKIYTGDKHPHVAQNPVAWKLRSSRTMTQE